MGFIQTKLIPFTNLNIQDKELIIRMLNFEDKLFLSEYGQNILREYGQNFISLEGSKTIQRITLNNFGFESDSSDLEIYRTIFSHYYKSAQDYDKEILNAVYYMRENRCLYYTSQIINLGDQIPNSNIYELDGRTQTDLYSIIKSKNYEKTIIGAFSMS